MNLNALSPQPELYLSPIVSSPCMVQAMTIIRVIKTVH